MTPIEKARYVVLFLLIVVFGGAVLGKSLGWW
jgi:hypothetical protein